MPRGLKCPLDYAGPIPEGFDCIDLPPCKMMIFQGQPYDDADFEEAIGSLWETIKHYNPKSTASAGPTRTGRVSSLSPRATGDILRDVRSGR